MGLSNAEHATWLNEKAAEEYENIGTLYIRNVNNNDNTITNQGIIQSFLEGATETIVASISVIEFSGGLGEETWNAKDERLTDDIERTTTDNSYVPIGIKRPVGA